MTTQDLKELYLALLEAFKEVESVRGATSYPLSEKLNDVHKAIMNRIEKEGKEV
jgi:hypothetical protein